MKKIIFSTMVALSLGTVATQADETKFYVDDNGQVFVNPADGRQEIVTPKADTPLFSKSDKLKFSALTYIGYTGKTYDKPTTQSGSDFEIRRAYFQVKAYLLEDKKSYYRVTLDATKDNTGDEKLRMKYAYLYLNDVLPSTGVELGLVHRPWHDYEEHNAWYYRNISKVLVESKNGADLSNSADFGFNFKTKTKYFDSEIGLFNGEGYHSDQNSNGMSLEWRATAHLLGVNGKDKQTKKTYLDVSFFGQLNQKHKNVGGVNEDLEFFGLHTVYNQPNFLVSAQYISSLDTRSEANVVSGQAGDGYSVNGEYRLGSHKQYRILGRYDSWTPEKLPTSLENEQKTYIAGLAWEQNNNVQWVINTIVDDNSNDIRQSNGAAYMLTAEVKF